MVIGILLIIGYRSRDLEDKLKHKCSYKEALFVVCTSIQVQFIMKL